MIINVSQLLQEPIGSTREYTIDETADVLGDGTSYPVKGECRLLRTKDGILVTCRADAGVELTCSRCLGTFRQPLSIRFEEEYVPTVDVLSGADLPEPEEAGTFTIDEHHLLDLNEGIRQYVTMAIPMKLLCRNDCAGLCQTCGKNLNQGPCGCPPPETDSRWAALGKLR